MLISAETLQQALINDLSQEIDPTLPGWAVDSSITQARCFILRDSLLKKFNSEERPSPAACEKALNKFLIVNNRCGDWSFAPVNSGEEEMLNGVKNVIYDFWFANQEPLVHDFDQLFLAGRAGPGASVSASGTDFYTKFFDSDISSTLGLHETWIQCASKYANWAESQTYRSSRHKSHVVESSNYSFVNKNVTVARGICTEPAINMWFQLGLGKLLEGRLARLWGIDIRGGKLTSPQPDINRVLAMVGSMTGQLSTIDLESASDSISLKMLKWLMPRTAFSLCDTLRCKSTKLPDGSIVSLNMVSTMGNGFTFPLETLVFAAVVIAVMRYSGVAVKQHGPALERNMAVFGDDILCPSSVTTRVIRVLELLGFTTNSEKTFVEGTFRESCGADFISGQNVRGVYIKSLNTLQDLFVAINRLNRWSAVSGVPLPETIGVLLQGIRKPHRFTVPYDENDDSGIKTPVDLALHNQKFGWRHGYMHRYTAHVPVSCNIVVNDDFSAVTRTKGGRERVHVANPHGLLLCALNGNIRGYSIPIRQRGIRYTTKRRHTPRWGYLPPQPLEGLFGPERHKRFDAAVRLNLLKSGVWEP